MMFRDLDPDPLQGHLRFGEEDPPLPSSESEN